MVYDILDNDYTKLSKAFSMAINQKWVRMFFIISYCLYESELTKMLKNTKKSDE